MVGAIKKVVLQGYIRVAEDELDAVKQALPEHIELTRSEPGCLQFSVEQDKNQQNRFNVYEVFESQQAFEFHQQRVKNSHWGRISTNVERHYQISQKNK